MLQCFYHETIWFNYDYDLIIIDWHFDDWERKQNLYLYNIVVVNKKTFFNFGKIPNQGNEEIYTILFIKEAQTSYLKKNTHRVGENFKNVFKLKFVWSSIDFFCFLYKWLVILMFDEIAVRMHRFFFFFMHRFFTCFIN